MNTRQTIAEITRRLPYLHRRDVSDVFDVLTELWRSELAKPDGEIQISGIGRLYVETHSLKVAGVIRQSLIERYGKNTPETIQRRVIRFSPFEALRTEMKQEIPDHE